MRTLSIGYTVLLFSTLEFDFRMQFLITRHVLCGGSIGLGLGSSIDQRLFLLYWLIRLGIDGLGLRLGLRLGLILLLRWRQLFLRLRWLHGLTKVDVLTIVHVINFIAFFTLVFLETSISRVTIGWIYE